MKTALKFLFVLLPVALVACYVQRYAVNMLFQDEFALIDLVVADAPEAELWVGQHQEHRPVATRLLYFAIAKMTAMNSIAQVAGSMTLAGVSLLLMGLYLKDEMGDRFKMRHLVLVSFLVFGFAQFINWLGGYQIAYVLTATSAVGAFFFMHRSMTRARTTGARWGYTVASCLCAVVATFATFHGLAVWPVLLAVMLLHVGRNAFKDLRFYGVLFVAAACGLLFFQGYRYPETYPSPLYATQHYFEFGRFMMRFLGSSLAPETYSAIVAGLGLLIGGLYVMYDYARRNNMAEYGFFPVALILFAFVVAFETALRMTNLGSDEVGRHSRYAAFSLLAVIGVALYLFAAHRNENPKLERIWLRRAATLFFGLVAVSLFVQAWRAERFGEYWNYERRMSAFFISTYPTQPDDVVIKTGGYHSKHSNDTDKLRAKKYNLFSWIPQDDPAVLNDPSKRLDAPRPATLFRWDMFQLNRQAKDPYILFESWAVDPRTDELLDSVYFYFNDKAYKAYYGNQRQDVAEFMGSDKYRFCGFERFIPLSEFPDGEYTVKLRLVNRDRTGYYENDPNAKMIVRNRQFTFADRVPRQPDEAFLANAPQPVDE